MLVVAGESRGCARLWGADVRSFESELISYFEGSAPEVLAELREKKEITKDLEKKLVEHVTKFRTAFLSRVKGR